jgi:hypothetical protein
MSAAPRIADFTRVTVVPGQAEARAVLARESTAIAVIRRETMRAAVFLCPCGCGDTLVINLDARAGKAWRVRLNHHTLTLLPSVWRTTGCRSHFVLWTNHVWWCDFDGVHDDDIEATPGAAASGPALPGELLAELKAAWSRIRQQGRR